MQTNKFLYKILNRIKLSKNDEQIYILLEYAKYKIISAKCSQLEIEIFCFDVINELKRRGFDITAGQNGKPLIEIIKEIEKKK